MPPRLPTRGELRAFCEQQGYRRRATDHDYSEKNVAPNVSVGTKVSLGNDNETLDRGLWTRIWKHQLRLASEDEFWRGLGGAVVQYNAPTKRVAPEPLPEYLARHLREVRHYDEERIAATSRATAQRLLNEWNPRQRG